MTGIAIVRAKLDRAKFHADAFASGWNQFYNRGTYAFTIRMDADPPYAIHFCWQVRDRTPDEEKLFSNFSLIYGDILSNLRATLDYLVWQLVLVAGNQPTDRTSFPYVKRRIDWASAAGDRLRGVDSRWIDEIEKLQPYHEGQQPERHLLAVLDHINNINKHRTLPPVIVTTQAFKFAYKHPDMPGRTFHFDRWLERPIENGVEFFRLTVNPPIPDPNIGINADLPIRIAFADGLDHNDGWSYTNDDLVQWVSKAVAVCEPAFPS